MTEKRSRIDFLLLLLILLNIFDVGSTYILVNNGANELNPLVNWLMTKVGIFWGIMVVKIPVLTYVILLLRSDRVINNPKAYKKAIIVLKICIGIYIVVMSTTNGPSLVYLWWLGSSAG